MRVGGPSRGTAPAGLVTEPRKTRNVPPKYPPDAQRARIGGAVILEAVIDRNGRVEDLRVLRSVPELDRAAIEAVSQWEYTPTTVNGVAVPVIMTVTVTFSIDGGSFRMGTPVAQPSGLGRPGFGRGATAGALVIRQDANTLTITRRFPDGSEEVKYRFDGRESRNRLPGTGGAVDSTYTFVSRWEGSTLVTSITWNGPQEPRQRTEKISLDGDTLTIQTIRLADADAEPFVQTNVFVRKK